LGIDGLIKTLNWIKAYKILVGFRQHCGVGRKRIVRHEVNGWWMVDRIQSGCTSFEDWTGFSSGWSVDRLHRRASENAGDSGC
jgi:hypothetical protein